MLSFLPGPARGVIAITALILSTIFWVSLLLIVSVFRIITPLKAWYLVLSNHQSWVDIVVLQKIFLNKIPFLKFFLKKELIWVPVLGLAWWALEFPFMKRYTREFLEKNPHLRGKDLEVTRKACEKYKAIPISIMNFPEGTRFRQWKHDRQQSPYKYLLKPRAGGIAFVLDSMGSMMHRIVDVTIYYPEGAKTLWEFLCGKTTRISVTVNVIEIKDNMRGDYMNDAKYSENFQKWLNGFWRKKDSLLADLSADRK